MAADERIARKLQIDEEEYVIYIRRLLLVRETSRLSIIEATSSMIRPGLSSSQNWKVTVLKGLFDGTGSPLIKRGELMMEATFAHARGSGYSANASPRRRRTAGTHLL